MQTEIHKIVKNLGGQVRYEYIPADVTHLIFTGKTNDLTKEFRTAREDKNRQALLLINYPGNPDGLTYTGEQLSQIAAVAKKHNCLVL